MKVAVKKYSFCQYEKENWSVTNSISVSNKFSLSVEKIIVNNENYF